MLIAIGNLTRLFSENASPYLPYRAHENIFCKCFEYENSARYDCSADAKKGRIGVGLKTWTGNDDQKVAEFRKFHKNYQSLSGLALVKVIAEYRNERIRVTKNIHGIDGKHTYHFSISKNTLYMIFEEMQILNTFEVEIMLDPYNFLVNLSDKIEEIPDQLMQRENPVQTDKKICVRLYSTQPDEQKKYFPRAVLIFGMLLEECEIQMKFIFLIIRRKENAQLDFFLLEKRISTSLCLTVPWCLQSYVKRREKA